MKIEMMMMIVVIKGKSHISQVSYRKHYALYQRCKPQTLLEAIHLAVVIKRASTLYFDRPNDPLPVGPIIGHIVAPMPRRKNKWAKESNDHQTERLLLRVFTRLFDPPFPLFLIIYTTQCASVRMPFSKLLDMGRSIIKAPLGARARSLLQIQQSK
ncbi:hypothetical protein OUZ56_007803 [Daphnia magna]|uniref:Uncharacterized protein n=1 Tax=Daphnia magna TaxID=35525 RepID=A0ABR0AB10_9CRUS|nr:hypothetical protein OUZ56_007803 [Daphnia magna]